MPGLNSRNRFLGDFRVKNLSGDPEQAYFSDGLAEDLITDLSKISGLYVAAGHASFAFKGTMAEIGEIADKLGVTHVLEGSVRKMGGRLRINAQLIDAANGGHVWAERYDGEMSEIFEFQDAFRAEIIAALEVQLSPTDRARGQRRRTESVTVALVLQRGSSVPVVAVTSLNVPSPLLWNSWFDPRLVTYRSTQPSLSKSPVATPIP